MGAIVTLLLTMFTVSMFNKHLLTSYLSRLELQTTVKALFFVKSMNLFS